jgi:putative restriction endonuclease
MEQLELLLQRLPDRHQQALRWFRDTARTTVGWPKPLPSTEGETLLASKAKGIYKPAWSPYALSVRQSLGGPYQDRPPIVRPDATWLFSYFQENTDVASRDEEFTNRALVECWKDRVPVGVMRQTSAKPDSRYEILGLAIVAGWDGGYFFLEGFAPDGTARPRGASSEIEYLASEQEQASLSVGAFDPSSVIDARERALSQIVRRRGQPQFRQKLLSLYGNRCAISGCDAVEVLEAAHITPYRGPETDHPTNGVLLRGDLHTLFDLGLIAIDVDTMTVLIAQSLVGTSYESLAGTALREPVDISCHPSQQALLLHRQWCGL